MKVYIGGALTHENQQIRSVYEKVASFYTSKSIDAYVPHLQGTDPVKNPEIKPVDVWNKNYEAVKKSMYVIAYVGKPSLGTGAEIEIARENGVEIILWWFKGERVSRMSLGNPAVKYTIEADDEDDLVLKLGELINI